jgi:hypothetical protein
MGVESKCEARVGSKHSIGTARLETETLQFRGGDLRLSIPFQAITKVVARGGTLAVTWPDGTVRLDLGAAAERWGDKILHPPSRLDKIGVKPGWRVSAVGVDDERFLAELESAAAVLSIGRVTKPSDAIFVGVARQAELSRLDTLRRSLTPAGALWVIRPKGDPKVSEAAVRAAGRAAGLVDVKVVRFSATHTAEKFVIPRSAR